MDQDIGSGLDVRVASRKGTAMSQQVHRSEVPRPASPAPEPNSVNPFDWLRGEQSGEETDLAHGQVVIVTARWILVGAGLALALWNPEAIGQLRIQVLVLLLIAVGNFFLHAQLLRRKFAVDAVAYAASAADLVVITLLVASQDGFDSNLFVFYFPAVLALSVAFRRELTAVYTAATVGAYALISFASFGLNLRSEDVQTLALRMLMIAAVALCGGLYQKIETDRRAGETMAGELERVGARPIQTAA